MNSKSDNQIKKEKREAKIFYDLFATYQAIEEQESKEAGEITYMAKSLIQTTLPYRKIIGNEYTRHNGNIKMVIMASSEVGIPYGVIPRLLINWVTTEAVLTQSKELFLGKNLSDFMAKLEIHPTGGKNGSITRLKKQMDSLFNCFINVTVTSKEYKTSKNLTITNTNRIWFKDDEKNVLTLSEDLYKELIKNPIPVDIHALKALKQSPMALDIYCWLTHRMSYLSKPLLIPWEILKMQFGSEHKLIKHFKADFSKQLDRVLVIYKANITKDKTGLKLKPSKTHIVKRVKIKVKAGDKSSG